MVTDAERERQTIEEIREKVCLVCLVRGNGGCLCYKEGRADWEHCTLCTVKDILSLQIGDYTIQQLIEMAAKAKSNDSRLAMMREEA
jgi:hypothetical protein